jgi:hypothetical protein
MPEEGGSGAGREDLACRHHLDLLFALLAYRTQAGAKPPAAREAQ